jgi:hypothetical protein
MKFCAEIILFMEYLQSFLIRSLYETLLKEVNLFLCLIEYQENMLQQK